MSALVPTFTPIGGLPAIANDASLSQMAGWGQSMPTPSSAMGMPSGPMAVPTVSPVGAQNAVGAQLQAGAAGRVAGAGQAVDTDAMGLGLNIGTGKLVLGGVQTLGNLWAAWEANKLAKEQFAYQKNVTEQNLANQMQTYNTTLQDRIRNRTFVEQGQAGGMTEDQGRQYVADNRLVRRA